MTAVAGALDIPGLTAETFALLRDARRAQIKRKAAGMAYWLYVAGLIVLIYGSSVVAGAFRALRHPPAPTGVTPHVLAALPFGLTALALLAVMAVLRDGLWRGPVTLRPEAADWLLGTPVDRRRLLRPRFWRSAVTAAVVGLAVGIVVTSALVEVGLGGLDTGDVMRLAGAACGVGVLLAELGVGCASLVERLPAWRRWLRRLTPVAVAAAIAGAGLAGWAAALTGGAVASGGVWRALAGIVAWSGPWGWGARAIIAVIGGFGGVGGLAGTGGSAGAGGSVGLSWAVPGWQLAVVSLTLAAGIALACGATAAAGVPAASLRSSSRAISVMSASFFGMDTRGFALAYGKAAGKGRRVRFRPRPPRRREFALAWRDSLALGRSPFRLVTAVVVAWLGAGLLAVSSHGGRVAVVPAACALGLGYLAAAWLCEGARLDADDPRRAAALPFSFPALAWRHAVVPALVLMVVVGVPVVVTGSLAGSAWVWPLLLVLVTVAVLVAGALVNVYRGTLPPDAFSGFDTPVGNTSAITIAAWTAMGPVLAVVPMTALLALGGAGFVAGAVPASGSGWAAVIRTAILALVLAFLLGRLAMGRARRLRAGALGRR